MTAESASIKVTTLHIGSSEHVINRPDVIEQHQGVGNLIGPEAMTLDTGHWIPWEPPN